MREDPRYVQISVDPFLAIDFGAHHRFGLVRGVIQMMAGGTRAQSRVGVTIPHAEIFARD